MILTATQTLEQFQQMNSTEAQGFLLKAYSQGALAKLDIEDIGTAEDRKAEIESVTELFFSQYSKFPTHGVLDCMANYILADYIKKKYKKKDEPLQFLTPTQEKARQKRELTGLDEDTMSYFAIKEKLNIPKERVTQEKSE
ncbi:hypothetical protein [Candidatus Enterococcus clewellii]|uniref:Uncharacterized protein n=1 Tax=Candidatus Enterococcus clewellii TaxID=1834193 RepID=A0A242KC44_9ENTE|nr:hypothetical protein [Enterococcus sp. 9E7_DIV0242]OTP18744.1 hypothetical protein A5888_000558 [Enterococcus sp. 9E7_DIV0242]